MSLPSLPGLVSGSLRSSTIGSARCLPMTIVQRSLFLAGPFTDKAAVGRRRLQMNFLMRLSIGLEIQIHSSERHGRRERGSQSWLLIVELYWFWMAWSRFKIHLVHKKDGYVSRPCKRFCVSLLPLIL